MINIYTDFASKSKRSPCNIMKSFVIFFFSFLFLLWHD